MIETVYDFQMSAPSSFSFFTAIIARWPWRGGNTRSHSEHGSQAPLRR